VGEDGTGFGDSTLQMNERADLPVGQMPILVEGFVGGVQQITQRLCYYGGGFGEAGDGKRDNPRASRIPLPTSKPGP